VVTISNLEKGQKIIKKAILGLSDKPGIYFMYNNNKEILYIGKAKHLNKRLLSYCNKSNMSIRIQRMVSQISFVDYTITDHEASALLLEVNMIKKYKPKYNILFRDDKSYPYILLRKDHDWSQVIKSRNNKNKDKGDYFGPFASADAVHKTLNSMQRAFPLRTCSDYEINNRNRPCLQYQIKRCSGPCAKKINKLEYNKIILEAKSFLLGKNENLQPKLQAQMDEASNNFKYEEAANLRDRIRALNYIQKAEGSDFRNIKNVDIFVIKKISSTNTYEFSINKELHFAIQICFYRAGKNFGNKTHFLKYDHNVNTNEILNSYIPQFYDNNKPPPHILVNKLPTDKNLIENALSLICKKKVKIIKPIKGENKKAISIGIHNINVAIAKRISHYKNQSNLIKLLSKRLNLDAVPKRIEIFDNSHFSGANMLGVMIVATQNGFMRNEYRKFNMKNINNQYNSADDYGMMKEMFLRRYSKFSNKNNKEILNKPDLIIVDGGKGQCNVACKVLKDLKIKNIIVIGVAKGIKRNAGNETIYFSSYKDYVPSKFNKINALSKAIIIEKENPVLYYVQRLRDEAHRFAINAQRNKQKKSLMNSELNNIMGIGPKRKKLLILHFGSIKNISKASFLDLKEVKGISENFAKKVNNYFNN